ncbi:hypothetical protein GCM10029978_042790 [Actinoallomurus acanthiterrae]
MPPVMLKGGVDTDKAGLKLMVVLVLFASAGLPQFFLALTAILEQSFGRPPPGEFGGWQTVVAIFGGFLVPMAVAAVFSLLGGALDRFYVGPHATWAEADAAFTRWETEVRRLVLTEAQTLLPPPATDDR